LNAKLVAFAEPSISPEPCEAALNDPGQPSNLECTLLALDDLKLVAVVPLQLAGELSALVPGISDHDSNVWECKAQAAE
jgi:hypothetical protein